MWGGRALLCSETACMFITKLHQRRVWFLEAWHVLCKHNDLSGEPQDSLTPEESASWCQIFCEFFLMLEIERCGLHELCMLDAWLTWSWRSRCRAEERSRWSWGWWRAGDWRETPPHCTQTESRTVCLTSPLTNTHRKTTEFDKTSQINTIQAVCLQDGNKEDCACKLFSRRHYIYIYMWQQEVWEMLWKLTISPSRALNGEFFFFFIQIYDVWLWNKCYFLSTKMWPE